MPFVTALAVGVVGSVISGAIGGSSSSNAADAQSAAIDKALAFQKQVYGDAQSNFNPYISTGQQNLGLYQSALPRITGELDQLAQPFTAQKFENSPGYAYALQQSQQAIGNSAAAKGGTFSGNTLNALQTNAIGLENQDYYNAYNQYLKQQTTSANILNSELGNLYQGQGIGSAAAGTLGEIGSNAANNIGSLYAQQGNAQAAGIQGQANAQSSALSGIGNAVVGYASSGGFG